MSGWNDNRPYCGEEKLIVSLDIGCTHTAVSFTHAYPGSKIDVQMVTKWPGQPEASGDSKIPTIVAYRKGKVIACGAEAREYIMDAEYEIAKWFKLYLHPDEVAKLDETSLAYDCSFPDDQPADELEIPRLPQGISLKTIYVEFIRYVFQATRSHFENNIPNGKNIWLRLISKAAIVFATPNGWNTVQHEFIKSVAVDAGLFESENDAEKRIEFITESEAAVHFVLHQTNCATWLHTGTEFAVVDCGGSTIDSTIYRCKATEPKLELEEISISECVQAGGVYVDRAAGKILKTKLAASEYGKETFVADMVDAFELKTKRLFDGQQESNIISFGCQRDNDRGAGIIQGKISLSKGEIVDAFSFSIEQVINSCSKLLSDREVHHLLLVGGFGESLHLRRQLKKTFQPQGVEIISVEQPAKKAAGEGATIWFIRQYVTTHTARYTVAAKVSRYFDSNDPEHWARRQLAFVGVDGVTRVGGGLSVELEKGTTLTQGKETMQSYIQRWDTKPVSTDTLHSTLYSWTGDPKSRWLCNEKGSLHPEAAKLCTLEASYASMIAQVRSGPGGTSYWVLDYDIVLSFTGTRLRARLKWTDKEGKTQYGPIKIIPAQVPSEREDKVEALRKAFARQHISPSS